MPTYYLARYQLPNSSMFYMFKFDIDSRLVGFKETNDLINFTETWLLTATKSLRIPTVNCRNYLIQCPSDLAKVPDLVVTQIPDLSRKSLASVYPEYFI